MCLELSDDYIDELAMGRLRGTKEQRHLEECCECQERVRRCREWITMLRQVLVEDRRNATPRNQIEPIQSEGSKKRSRLSTRTRS